MNSTNAGTISSVRLAVTTALLGGDPASAFYMVRDLMEQGVPFDVVLFDVVAPAHANFGTRWQSGDYRIADEHAATGAVESLVAMLAGSFDLPEAGEPVVVTAAEGDHHSLPARLTRLSPGSWLSGPLPGVQYGSHRPRRVSRRREAQSPDPLVRDANVVARCQSKRSSRPPGQYPGPGRRIRIRAGWCLVVCDRRRCLGRFTPGGR